MRVALLAGSVTNPYAASLFQELTRRGHSPGRVVVRPSGARLLGALRHPRRAVARLGDAPPASRLDAARLQVLVATLRTEGFDVDCLARAAASPTDRFVRAESPNAPGCVRALADWRPDAVVYASGGILRRPLIDTAHLGVLNAHMGILPRFRGMNVLEWSLVERAPLGVTVHFVDPGIDTGQILATEGLVPTPGDTIESLRARAAVIAVRLIADTIDALAAGTAMPRPNPRQEGRQYFRMHPDMLEVARRRLRELTGPA